LTRKEARWAAAGGVLRAAVKSSSKALYRGGVVEFIINYNLKVGNSRLLIKVVGCS